MFRFAHRFSLMPIELITLQPWWFLLLCPAVGFLYAFFLYRKEQALALSKGWILLIAFSRFLTISTLGFLLSGAYIKSLSRSVEKPFLIFAQDNSSSIRPAHDSIFIQEYTRHVDESLTKLSSKFEVKRFTFGNKVTERHDFDFTEPETDFSELFEELNVRFANTNTGALIISSDGLYNRGNNPLYQSKQISYPVYTVALGDTVQKKDLLISSVSYNRLVSAGNRIVMEIYIEARYAAGILTEFKVEDETGILISRPIQISGKLFSTKIPVSFIPSGKGIKNYRLTLGAVDGELTYGNNYRDIFIEVADRKLKILLLAAAPHPDIAAIKQCLELNPDYEINFSPVRDFKQSLRSYNLIIFHQSPTNPQELNLAQQAIKEKIPCWFICGLQTSPLLFNQLETGIKIQDFRSASNEMLPALNPTFSAFSLNAELATTLSNFPPLNGNFGLYKVTGPGQILLFQKIGNITTQQPLLAFHQVNVKIGVLTGEGIWRWKLSEYRNSENQNTLNEIISKTVQYLLYNEDKNPLKVYFKKEYTAGEPLVFEADLYDATGELTNEPDVKMTISGEDKKQFEFVFSKTRNNNYMLNAGRLIKGKYRFKATSKSGEMPVAFEGEFSIAQTEIESLNSLADHQLLNSMAALTGGKMFYPDQLSSLTEELMNRTDIKPVSYSETKLRDLIDLKWLFALLVIWLSLEWFIRKQSGSY